jgi:hypothetical protein
MKPMRIYVLLIFLAVSLAFSAGLLSLSIRKASRTAQGSAAEIAQLKARFQREHPPRGEVVLPSLFPALGAAPLLDPAFAFPQNRTITFKKLSELQRYSKACSGSLPKFIADPLLAKSWQWQAFECGKAKELPEEFFESPPFVSALGGSFAFRALQSPEKPGVDRDWIQRHLRFFHVTELKSLREFQVEIDPPRAILASLGLDALKSLSDGNDFVLDENSLLFKKAPASIWNSDGSGHTDGATTYLFYERVEWDRELSRTDYRTEVFRGGQLCLLKEGQVCWRIGTDEAFRTIQAKTLALFVVALAMAGLCAWIAIGKFRLQKLEEERKRFALQTLAHELRTPLSSLVVSSEEVLDHFDTLPTELQGTLVRMCDDIQRLHRLTEVSKHYLGSQNGSALIQFDFKSLPSIKEYLESVLEPFIDRIEAEFPECEGAFVLDPYWVGVCIKNLVENSLQHGEAPVRFTAKVENGLLDMTIEDGGTKGGFDLETMALPFSKGSSSRGLGLGLAIVRNIVDTLGAEISFEPSPTRFKLRVREGKVSV